MNNPGGEFSYMFRVSRDPRSPMHGQVCEPSESKNKCSLGPTPVLTWAEYTPEPWKLYGMVTLTASQKRGAAEKAAALTIDRGLLTILREGDEFRVSASESVGVSIIRNDHLIAAAGRADILSEMFLGKDVQVHFPGENLAARFGNQPGSLRWSGPAPSSDHAFVEIAAGGDTRILPSGRPDMGPYEVFLRQSVRPGVLCVSIERRKICPEMAAHMSAQLLDRQWLKISRW